VTNKKCLADQSEARKKLSRYTPVALVVQRIKLKALNIFDKRREASKNPKESHDTGFLTVVCTVYCI